ncbi:hypothetical protein DBV15_05140 [Temnothorax longispinosus]|uniref:Uncharacterized protein n=1 Tax=Temnothorax longispinosus TaxID=300112 RepID=A0A4S2KU78_9HYME|nr:hypothetical protein DBV15_05140 [Temnothorax longispinosus]
MFSLIRTDQNWRRGCLFGQGKDTPSFRAIGIKIAAAEEYARITIKTSTQLITSDTWSRSVPWPAIVIGLILELRYRYSKTLFLPWLLLMNCAAQSRGLPHSTSAAPWKTITRRETMKFRNFHAFLAAGYISSLRSDIRRHSFLPASYLASHVNGAPLSDEYQPVRRLRCRAVRRIRHGSLFKVDRGRGWEERVGAAPQRRTAARYFTLYVSAATWNLPNHA